MKVTLSITTKIPAKVKLSKEKTLELVGKLLPGKDMVRVEGGKYTYLVVFEDYEDEKYGEWMVYRLGKCEMCGKDVLEGGVYCEVCLQVRLRDCGDEYYHQDQCRELVRKIGDGLSRWEKRRMAKEWVG